MHRFLLKIFFTLSKSNDEAFILAIIHLSMLFNTQIVLEIFTFYAIYVDSDISHILKMGRCEMFVNEDNFHSLTIFKKLGQKGYIR